MVAYARRCLRGEGSLAEAGIGVLLLGGCALSLSLGGLALALGGIEQAPRAVFAAIVVRNGYLLFAAVCVWRCAFNTRYWGVGAGARVLAFGYAAGIVALAPHSLGAI